MAELGSRQPIRKALRAAGVEPLAFVRERRVGTLRCGEAALEFFRWAYASGRKQAESLDYVPLPAELVQQVETYWAAQLK